VAVACANRHVFAQCLCNDQPVERITVMERQGGKPGQMVGLDG
jgi:hypothetical protein